MKIVLILVFIFTNTVLFAQPPFDDYTGDGTVGNPYNIYTKAHLMELGDSINSVGPPYYLSWVHAKHFRLMQDIDSITQSVGWRDFGGHFYAGGNKITLTINNPPPFNLATGLFNYVSMWGSIDSLTVKGYVHNGLSGIVSFNWGIISNCTSNVTITSEYGHIGGISYSNITGIISNCVFNGSMVSTNEIGGIVGENSGHIINCINNGKITATNSGANTGLTGQPTSNNGVGGIVGSHPNATGGSIRNNINTGSVEGQNMAGGIVGVVVASSGMYPILPTINNINYGFVKGNKIVGGILGWVIGTNINISNNSNFGVVVGEEDTGCIVGKNNGGNISNNHYDKQMCGE